MLRPLWFLPIPQQVRIVIDLAGGEGVRELNLVAEAPAAEGPGEAPAVEGPGVCPHVRWSPGANDAAVRPQRHPNNRSAPCRCDCKVGRGQGTAHTLGSARQ